MRDRGGRVVDRAQPVDDGGEVIHPALATEVVRPQPALAIAALVVALVGLVIYAALVRATRPRRPPFAAPTQELGPEPPAVVDLLVGAFEPDTDAIAATLVDLAARGFVEIFEAGPDNVLVRVRPSRAQVELASYETRVLDHLTRLAGPDGTVPADALTTGDRAASDRWRGAFAREVVADAQARGLCRPRWSVVHAAVVWAAFVATGVMLWLSYELGTTTEDVGALGDPTTLAWGLGALGAVVLFTLAGWVSASHAQRDTDQGLAAAERWSGVRAWYELGEFHRLPAASVAIWDRHLAYATAVGAAPMVDRQLNFEAEHDHRAWSRHGDRFRQVQVRYWSWRPGWGSPPWEAALSGAVQAVVFGAFLSMGYRIANDQVMTLDDLDSDVRRWVSLAALVVSVVVVPLFVWGLAKFVLGVADLVPRRDREGLVVRARVRRGRSASTVRNRSGKISHHIALDDGSTDRITTHRLRRDRYRDAPQGAVVRLRVSPLLGYVARVEAIDVPPAFDGPPVPDAGGSEG